MSASRSNGDRWHTARQTAELLGIGHLRLRKSDLPYLKVGRSRYYLRSAIEEYRPVFEVNGRADFCRWAFTVHPRWTDEHGRSRALTDHPLYETWRGMIDRCYVGRRPGSWELYGGRGIRVYGPWHDLPTFTRDMPPRPTGRTLHRTDNDGGYWPNNAVWATRAEQAANRGPGLGRPFCHCAFDCSALPGVCPFKDVPWSVAAGVARAELQRIEALRDKPLPSLVQHVHTGAHDDCFACLRQDPFRVLSLFGDERSPHEHCAAAAGYTHRHLAPLGLFGA